MKKETSSGGGRRAAVWSITAALCVLGGAAEAAGLRTKFGEVVLRGLKIGQTYSLERLINLPLRLLNTGEETVDLKIDVIAITTASTKAGYDPIPDISWIKLSKQEFTLEPNHEAVTDVVVSLPNDPSLLGRRFEADIWSRTQSKFQMFAVGVQSRLLIHIDSTPPTEEELKKKFVDRRIADLDFTLLPAAGTAEGVPLGVDYNLKKERKLSIKLINPNDVKINFRIRSVPNWEALLAIPAGYEDAYDPRWLKFAAEIIEVEGNSIKETGMILHIPDEDRYRGKAFLFPVAVDVLEQEISARVYYKLLVTTKSKPDAQAPTDGAKN